MLKWVLDKRRAIVPQICEQVCMRIATGEFAPNERLLSVRDIALVAGVNPNTVQKAFDLLEQRGILYSHRGSGWYVSENVSDARLALNAVLQEKTAEYFAEMKALGVSVENIKSYVLQWKDN